MVKECSGLDRASLVPLSPLCIHVAVRPYLVTAKHCRAVVPQGPSSVNSAGQTDRRPVAHGDRSTLIRQDKRVTYEY